MPCFVLDRLRVVVCVPGCEDVVVTVVGPSEGLLRSPEGLEDL